MHLMFMSERERATVTENNGQFLFQVQLIERKLVQN